MTASRETLQVARRAQKQAERALDQSRRVLERATIAGWLAEVDAVPGVDRSLFVECVVDLTDVFGGGIGFRAAGHRGRTAAWRKDQVRRLLLELRDRRRAVWSPKRKQG